jgi:hypothetical protein
MVINLMVLTKQVFSQIIQLNREEPEENGVKVMKFAEFDEVFNKEEWCICQKI